METTAMLTARGQHANQDSLYLIGQNAEEIARVIRLGSVLIIIVGVEVISLFKMGFVLTATQRVGHVAIQVILIIVSVARISPGVL
jgi:hypothetical protein